MAGTIDDIFASMNAATGDNVSLDGSLADTTSDEGNDPGLEQEVPEKDGLQQLPEDQSNENDNTKEEVEAKPNQQQNKPQQNKQPAKKDVRQEGPKTDDKGNIVDAEGKVIATAGVQRRLYEQNQRMSSVIQHKDHQIAQLTQQIQQSQVLNALPQRLGINNEEVEGALRIAYAFKQNPVEAARIVVAEALKKGHNLDEIIGEQQAGTLQMSAIRQMINENLGPIQAERQQVLEQQRIQRESEAAFNQFLVNYPDAEFNIDTLAELMAKDPQQGNPYQVAERAYLRLSDYCRRNGLDISKPLAEQINRQAPAPANKQRNVQQRPNAALPSPNAGRTVVNAPVTSTPVSANSSWRDIINSVKQDLARGN